MESQEVITKTKWAIDPAHSEIGFKVKHLMFANVRGYFKEFTSRIYTTGDDFMSAEIEVTINAASVDTRIQQRDDHLRSADFFEADTFKEIKFRGNTFVATDREARFEMYGELIIKGVTNEIKLDVEFGGVVKDPSGAEKALFTIEGKINRRDWGLNYHSVLETGGLVVSEDVWIHCDIQLIKES